MTASRRAVRAMAGLVAAAVVLAALPACSGGPGSGPVVTADFIRANGLYPDSPVRVLGIDIGRVTTITNTQGHVRLRLQLNRGVRLPADARATIVPFTLLGERYVQLGPAWRSGPILANGAHIPLSRTSVPAELDDLLRGLRDFMGGIDPNRARDVVTNLAQMLQGRGDEVNSLIHNAAGTLGILADKGEDLKAIVVSLRDLSATLKGRTGEIDTLIQNYDLVSQVLVDNKNDLNGVITELDRATVELSGLLVAHQDPLRSDVRILATTGGTIAANTENLQLTLKSTVKLFEAAGRAYEARTNSLRVNNQLSPELTSDVVAGRLRDRIAGLCRRLGIPTCSSPSSPLLESVAGLLPGLLAGSDQLAGSSPPSAPPSLPTAPPSLPPVVAPTAPDPNQLLTMLTQQLTGGLTDAQKKLLQILDGPRLAALLELDPVLLQVLPKLNKDQIDRLRKANLADIPNLMLDLYNEVFPPGSRLDTPLLPPITTPPVTSPTVPGSVVPTIPGLGG